MTATHIPHTPPRNDPEAVRGYEQAERVLLDEHGVAARSRRLLLADTALVVRVLETGAGDDVVLLHGSGRSAPVLAQIQPVAVAAASVLAKRHACRAGASARADTDPRRGSCSGA